MSQLARDLCVLPFFTSTLASRNGSNRAAMSNAFFSAGSHPSCTDHRKLTNLCQHVWGGGALIWLPGHKPVEAEPLLLSMTTKSGLPCSRCWGERRMSRSRTQPHSVSPPQCLPIPLHSASLRCSRPPPHFLYKMAPRKHAVGPSC